MENINAIKLPMCAVCMHILYRDHTVFKALKTSCLSGLCPGVH